MGVYDSFFDQSSDKELVASIHTKPFFRPESLQQESTQTVATTFLVILITHISVLVTLRQKYATLTREDSMKVSYRATNFLINLVLGFYGLYTIYITVPDSSVLLHPDSTPSIVERITGFEQYTHFSSYQLAYNMWALPVGIFFVGEDKFMILHHISVLLTSGLGCYTAYGYRYAAPFIFGMAELSSIPLAITNFLKDHREWTRKHCEALFAFMKVLFAVMFLYLRVYVSTPLILDLLRSCSLILRTSIVANAGEGNGLAWTVAIGLFLLDFVFKSLLGFLQFYWAYLIVKILGKMAVPSAAPKEGTKAQ